MKFEKEKETIYVKNIVDYQDYKPIHSSSNMSKGFSNKSIKSGIASDLSSIDERIINILNFDDELDLEGDSHGSDFDGADDDSMDDLDDIDFDEDLEFLCSLGLDLDDDCSGIDKDSIADYFNPAFENPDELAFLSFFDDFVLIEMGFDDMIREVYFEE